MLIIRRGAEDAKDKNSLPDNILQCDELNVGTRPNTKYGCNLYPNSIPPTVSAQIQDTDLGR